MAGLMTEFVMKMVLTRVVRVMIGVQGMMGLALVGPQLWQIGSGSHHSRVETAPGRR